MSSELIELFSKLTINDTRINKQVAKINIITNMITKLDVSSSYSLDELVDGMNKLTITDENIIIEFNNHQVITFRYAYFNCGDKLINNIPKWSDAY